MDCDYCGKKNKTSTFVIGAKSKTDDDFCMVYGTGKMACGDCYPKAAKEGSDAVDRHIAEHNKRVTR